MGTPPASVSLSGPSTKCRVMDRAFVFSLPPLEDPTVPIMGRRFFHYSPSQILKLGTHTDEATTTKLAYELLGEKAPRLDDVFHLTDRKIVETGIIVSRLPGKPLSVLWPSLDTTQRTVIKKRLAELLVFTREPRAGIDYYGRPNEQPYTIPDDDRPNNKHDFCRTRSEWDESRIRALHVESRGIGVTQERIVALEHIQRSTGAGGSALIDRPVLMHGDLSARNFLVEPTTLEVTGIIDWETANIAPAYFEFVQARLTGGHNPFWRTEILDVLEQVLRIECDRAVTQGSSQENVTSEALFEETLAAWKAMVKVERPAQGFSDKCYWTFEEQDEETRKNWDWGWD